MTQLTSPFIQDPGPNLGRAKAKVHDIFLFLGVIQAFSLALAKVPNRGLYQIGLKCFCLHSCSYTMAKSRKNNPN